MHDTIQEDARVAPGSDRRNILLPDTHAHLDAYDNVTDLSAVLKRAEQAGIVRILAVGSDLASSERAIAIAAEATAVYAAVGIHPHEANRFFEEAAQVRSLIGKPRVVAVGEIGLDYYRVLASRDEQRAAFDAQLDWAREANLPVSVHNRDADEDVLRALRASGVAAVLHCFSANWETAQIALRDGHYLSFAGNVTYPKAGELRDIAARVPIDRLLVETDSPVLPPQPWRGKRNEPAHVTATAEVLAQLRGMSADRFSGQVRENAERLFRWRAA